MRRSELLGQELHDVFVMFDLAKQIVPQNEKTVSLPWLEAVRSTCTLLGVEMQLTLQKIWICIPYVLH